MGVLCTVLCPRESWITWRWNAWNNCKQVQCSYFFQQTDFVGFQAFLASICKSWSVVTVRWVKGLLVKGDSGKQQAADFHMSVCHVMVCSALSPFLFFLVFSFKLWGQSPEHHVTFKGIAHTKWRCLAECLACTFLHNESERTGVVKFKKGHKHSIKVS